MLDRILTFVIVCGVVGAIAVQAGLLTRHGMQPGLHDDSYDFGVVGTTKLTHQFALRNTSDNPIDILYTLKSCGCTSVSVPSVIPPRSSVPLRCVLDTHGARGSVSTFVKVAFREHGKPNEQRREFGLHATVRPNVTFEPDTITFIAHRSQTQHLAISSRVNPEVQILGLETDHQAINVCVDPDGKGAAIKFDAAQWTDETGFGVLRVRTSDPDEKEVRLIVSIVPPSKTR